MVPGTEPSEADGADGADGAIVPAEAEPTGTRVVLLDTGYGATSAVLLTGPTGPVAGAVLRMGEEGPVLSMTARVEEFAVTTGAEETVGVTIGATGVEETAVGVATTGYVVVQGQASLIVRVVACE